MRAWDCTAGGLMLLGQEEVAGKYKAQTSGRCVDHRCLCPQLLLGLGWTKDVRGGTLVLPPPVLSCSLLNAAAFLLVSHIISLPSPHILCIVFPVMVHRSYFVCYFLQYYFFLKFFGRKLRHSFLCHFKFAIQNLATNTRV